MGIQKSRLLMVGLAVAGFGMLFAVHQPQKTYPPIEPQIPQTQPTDGQVAADDEAPPPRPYSSDIASADPTPAKPATVAAIAPSALTPAKPAIPAAKIEDGFLTIDNQTYPLRTYKPLSTPNDPSAAQWWVTNTKLDQAWDIPAGGHQTLLAVIDTGFALAHEEFSGRWYSNPGESGTALSEGPSSLNCSDRGLALNSNCDLVDNDGNGIVDDESGTVSLQNPSRLNCTGQGKPLAKDCNRLDDDGNGLVDDVSGWDFADFDNSPQAGELNPVNGTGTSHGTRVAGIAAATGNNAKGIAGVDWQTKILPIQALDDSAYGNTYDVGRAIRYAASQGADVISLSLGSVEPDDYVLDAVHDAIAAGSVVVAAAGNDGCNCITYPANYPEVVAVGALDTNSLPASFSSYGANLDILAPGNQMRSASWTVSNGSSTYASGIAGTSYAAPLVSGLLTRLLSQQPDAKPLQLIASLTENTNRLSLADSVARSDTLGYGSTDAQRASSRMATGQTSSQVYRFVPASTGSQLNPSSPAEASGTFYAQNCADGRPGSTVLYELSKGTGSFYSLSPSEEAAARADGYTSRVMTRTCLSEPHDTPATVRNLNLYKEFRDILENRL